MICTLFLVIKERFYSLDAQNDGSIGQISKESGRRAIRQMEKEHKSIYSSLSLAHTRVKQIDNGLVYAGVKR